MAHPTLTGRLEHEICALISLGVPLRTAARMIGVCPRTVTDWYVLGRKPGAKPHWQEFAESIEVARAEHDQAVRLRLAALRGELDRF